MVKIGYARVSTLDQNLDRQIAALRAEGCTKIFREKVSGKDMRTGPSSPRPSMRCRPKASWCWPNGTGQPDP